MGEAFYNENEPFAAEWLRRLERGGRIAAGRVDARSIRELSAADVAGATQFHAFAGIGVWSYALRLAGWPDDRPVWTGSCPCQPFSQAGARGGIDDGRHLWPEWFRLIRECRPGVVLGEQVSSPDGLAWFDAVSADLEGEGYAIGALDLCAAGIGAPHLRQRLYFVAVADAERDGGGAWRFGDAHGRSSIEPDRHGDARRVAHDDEGGRALVGEARLHDQGEPRDDAARRGATLVVADPDRARGRSARGTHASELAGAHRDPWAECVWIPCRDPRYGVVYRPVERRAAELGALPLADGVAAGLGILRTGDGYEITHPLRVGEKARVGKLRGYGNGLVAECAATFIEAVMEVIGT